MKIVPASDVPAGPLRAFFASLPDGEQAFLKDDARDPETIAAWRRAGPAGRLAAVDSTGTVAGVVSVIPELGWSDHVGQLTLIVDPSHRGQGIGGQLARAALLQALELGLSKITVEVMADQEPAARMFTSLGFAPEALLRAHVRDRDGVFHDLLVLAHSVDDNWQAFGTAGISDEIG